ARHSHALAAVARARMPPRPAPGRAARRPPRRGPAGGAPGGGGAAGPGAAKRGGTPRHPAPPRRRSGAGGAPPPPASPPPRGRRGRAPGTGGGSDLYWADDVCAPGACDVLHDTAVGVLRRDADGWKDLGDTPLPGTVQQNTGTLAAGDVLHTYGVDVAGHAIV